jgi:hypothetical protein
MATMAAGTMRPEPCAGTGTLPSARCSFVNQRGGVFMARQMETITVSSGGQIPVVGQET